MEEGFKKPSWFLHLTEIIRAIFETLKGYFFVKNTAPQNIGNGRVVVVLPGLLSTDISTKILRRYLQKLGFTAYGWEMGRNLGRMAMLPVLAEKVADLSGKHNQKLILIGWSMGGIFAREIAKLKPENVEKIITLGSPFADVYAPNHARWVFDLLNDTKDLIPEIVEQLAVPPTQATVAFYSKKDGIVPWKACMDLPESSLHQNIEIKSSHFAMGANEMVLKALQVVLEK